MIEVEGLSFTYPRAPKATLEGVSFEVAEGEIFGFLGPSGAGKSTTQKVLIGLLRGYEGVARVLGREVREWGADLYERVGVSFELPNHYNRLTARENLEHFGALYAEAPVPVMEVLEWVGLQDDADKRVSDFSKGMKNRLNVARSLIHRPKLLFLDEPTSGLDPVSARRMRELVRRVRDEGATVFLNTHDMVTADEVCDRVAFITAGGIREIGAPAALRKTHGRRVVRVEYVDGEEPASAEFALDGLGDDAAFAELLRSHPIETLHSQETTLERVFVDVTGEALRP